MDPAVSVILPVYNAEYFIAESINCILKQSFSDFELIIINDGSDDKSKDIILSINDKRIRYLENKRNIGLVKTLNKAICSSNGKFIARMDADDICHSTRFEKQIMYMHENPDIAILGTTQFYIGSGESIKNTCSWQENKIRLLLEPVVGHSSVMMRRDMLNQYDLHYDRNALYAEDYKLWVEASLFDLKIENLQDPLCGYRRHNNSISEKFFKKQFYTAQRIRLLYGSFFFPEIIDRNPLNYLRFLLTPGALRKHEAQEIGAGMIKKNEIKNFFDHELFLEFIMVRLRYHCDSI